MPDNLYTAVTPQPKPEKRVKDKTAKTKIKKSVNEQIHKRDGGRCIVCKKLVSNRQVFHHIEYRSEGGKDIVENGCLLGDFASGSQCNCHGILHDVGLSDFIQEVIDNVGLKRTVQFILKGMIK